MAVTQRNSNAAMILLFLYRLVEARGRCSIALASAAAALGRLCAARRVGRRSLTPPFFCGSSPSCALNSLSYVSLRGLNLFNSMTYAALFAAA